MFDNNNYDLAEKYVGGMRDVMDDCKVLMNEDFKQMVDLDRITYMSEEDGKMMVRFAKIFAKMSDVIESSNALILKQSRTLDQIKEQNEELLKRIK